MLDNQTSMKKNYKKPVLSLHGDLKEITKSGYGEGEDLREEYGSTPG